MAVVLYIVTSPMRIKQQLKIGREQRHCTMCGMFINSDRAVNESYEKVDPAENRSIEKSRIHQYG